MCEVNIWFDPPQPAAGQVYALHESGYEWRGDATPTGTTFHMPAGPCSLRLERGGVVVGEAALKVPSGTVHFDWSLPR